MPVWAVLGGIDVAVWIAVIALVVR